MSKNKKPLPIIGAGGGGGKSGSSGGSSSASEDADTLRSRAMVVKTMGRATAPAAAG